MVGMTGTGAGGGSNGLLTDPSDRLVVVGIFVAILCQDIRHVELKQHGFYVVARARDVNVQWSRLLLGHKKQVCASLFVDF